MPIKKNTTHRDIVQRFKVDGGYTKLSKVLTKIRRKKVSKDRIGMWANPNRNSIPRIFHRDLVKAGEIMGIPVTFEEIRNADIGPEK